MERIEEAHLDFLTRKLSDEQKIEWMAKLSKEQLIEYLSDKLRDYFHQAY